MDKDTDSIFGFYSLESVQFAIPMKSKDEKN